MRSLISPAFIKVAIVVAIASVLPMIIVGVGFELCGAIADGEKSVIPRG
jgi:hypothetical protein